MTGTVPPIAPHPPWRRTLDDAAAGDAVAVLERVREGISGRRWSRDAGREVRVAVAGPAPWITDLWIEFFRGCLQLHLHERTGGGERRVAFVDTSPAVAACADGISLDRFVATLERWLDGLRSPYRRDLPRRYVAVLDEAVERVAAAACLDEPDWEWLEVDLGTSLEGPSVLVVAQHRYLDVVIGARPPDREMHPDLAARLLRFKAMVTQVRAPEGDTIVFGEPETRSASRPDAVETLRLFARRPGASRLYALGQP